MMMVASKTKKRFETDQRMTASIIRALLHVGCYPSFGFGQPDTDYGITLLCGLAILNGEINGTATGVGCSPDNISLQSTTVNGAFDPTDDSVITLIFAEDVGGVSCGAEGLTSYTLTKN